jgi:hypothetical protein
VRLHFLVALLLAGVCSTQTQNQTFPISPSDLSVLRAIFAEGGGADWKEGRAKSTWNSTSLDGCLWFGVVCGRAADAPQARVTGLVLSGFGLTALTRRIAELAFLTELELSGNSLRALPDSVGAMGSLRRLSVAGNRLEALPEALAGLSQLEMLGVAGNLISSIPESIGSLSSLRYLYLQSNRLVCLPAGVSRLGKLIILFLFGNPLSCVLPDLSGMASLEGLSLANTRLVALPAMPLATLLRLDVNDNNFTGVVRLCGPRLATINANDNPNLTGIEASGQLCLPALTSINLARCNLTSVSFLRDSVGLVDLDVSGNRFLGNGPFEVAKEGRWPALASLRAESIGTVMRVAEVLVSVLKIATLISLDLSGNAGVTGDLSADEFIAAGVRDQMPSFNLILLRLDGTSVGNFVVSGEELFNSLRVLSLRNTTLFRTEQPVPQQGWLHLEQVDLRGTNPSVVVLDPSPFPGSSSAVDVATNSVCPTTLVGGTVSKFAIVVDPSYYNYTLCRCQEGHFGEPWRGCLECPRAPTGDTSTGVDCRERPGELNVTGGWIVFDAARGGVAVASCPSDSARSPCASSVLERSIRTLDEWDMFRSRAPLNCTAGFEGRLCSRCAPGFFRSGRGCFRCGAKGLSWLNPILSVAGLTAIGVKSVSGGFSARSGLIRTLTMHAQLVVLLPDLSLKLSEWAGFFVKASGSGAGGFHLNGLECAGARGWDGFYAPFAQAAALPAIALVGSVWLGLLSGLVSKGKGMPLRSRVTTALLYLWLVLLFGAMQRLLAPFNCTPHGSNHGRRYLAAALWVPCDGAGYRGLLAVSVLLGLGYIFATLGVVVYRLRPSSKGTSAVSQFLRSPYSEENYYWEAVQLVRRVALAMASSLTNLYSPAQPVAVSSILILSLFAHTWRKPYHRWIDNLVESVSLTLLLASYMAGLIASNPHFPQSATSLISWVFFAFNAIFLLSLTFTVLFRSAKTGMKGLKEKRNKKMGDIELTDE